MKGGASYQDWGGDGQGLCGEIMCKTANQSAQTGMVRQRTRPLSTLVASGLPYPVPVMAEDYKTKATP